MKKIITALFFSSFLFLLSPLFFALAHEGGAEVTDLSAADWTSPLIAAIIIAAALAFAAVIKKSK